MTDTVLEAVWCVDSETGQEVLIDLATGKIIAHKINGEIQDEDK